MDVKQGQMETCEYTGDLHLSLPASNFDDVGDLQRKSVTFVMRCTGIWLGLQKAERWDTVGAAGAQGEAAGQQQPVWSSVVPSVLSRLISSGAAASPWSSRYHANCFAARPNLEQQREGNAGKRIPSLVKLVQNHHSLFTSKMVSIKCIWHGVMNIREKLWKACGYNTGSVNDVY